MVVVMATLNAPKVLELLQYGEGIYQEVQTNVYKQTIFGSQLQKLIS